MDCAEKFDYLKDAGVFTLLTKLCEKVSSDYCNQEFGSINHDFVKQLRSKAYEIILKKSSLCVSDKQPTPIMDLLSYMYVMNTKCRNVQEYCNANNLKELIDWAITVKKNNGDDSIFVNILQCLVCLKDTIPKDIASVSYQNPFSFGMLDEMLPKPMKVDPKDPEPYHYFPPRVFELPYSLKCSNVPERTKVLKNNSYSYLPFDASMFASKSSLGRTKSEHEKNENGVTFGMSVINCDVSHLKCNYPSEGIPTLPRLVEPRDLSFGYQSSAYPVSDYDKILAASSNKLSTKYIVETSKSPTIQIEHYCHTNAIWDIASAANSLPHDIWETVSKMPPLTERNLITMSGNQMALWKEIYKDKIRDLDVVSEPKLINHLIYLLLGIETTSFILNRKTDAFNIFPTLCLEGVSQERLHGYLADYLVVGTFYHRLNKIVSANRYEGMLIRKGFIFEAMSDKLREYLLKFGMKISHMYNQTSSVSMNSTNAILPTLLKILNDVRPMRREIETVAKIHKVHYEDQPDSLPKGASLMAYLYQEVTLITHPQDAKLFYSSLIATCKVYFKFIQRFIFEGELDDNHDEFFITKDPNYVESPTKRYWDKGFVIRHPETVPEFVKDLAENILLCGKSFRLLKLCNPEDPLCILLSTEHPMISCCTTFDQIEKQHKVMDVFRTRCLFVCGEPITFREMILRKEAERKACCELAQIKNAETLHKIVEERKRLQRILNEEKMHCQQMMLKAAREAKEARQTRGARGRAIAALQDALTQAQKNTEDLIIEDEKKKMINYYNELGQEVEKRKVRSEWKLKRLKLDEMRVQLLTSEERNFKREKIELQYRNSADEEMVRSCDMSLLLCDQKEVNIENDNLALGDCKNNNLAVDPASDAILDNMLKEEDSSDKISILFQATKCDKPLNLYFQNSGTFSDINENPIESLISSKNPNSSFKLSSLTDKIIGFSGLNLEADYLKRKSEAEKNKLKVMNHEFGNSNKISETDVKVSNLGSEAETNRNKVLGGTWFKKAKDINRNLDPQPQFNTEESKQALKNKMKILSQEYGLNDNNETTKQRLGLTLDLNKVQKTKKFDWRNFDESKVQSGNLLTIGTPSYELNTPSDVFNQLDLETPTTCEVAGISGDPSAESLSPQTVPNTSFHRHRVSSDGFTFPSMIVESISDDEDNTIIEQDFETEIDAPLNDALVSPRNDVQVKSTVWNFTNDHLNFDSFVTCGLKNTDMNTSLPFTTQMMSDEKKSFYTPIEEILQEAQRKPMEDLYLMNIHSKESDDDCDTANADFSTLSVCLKRSIVVPLTYQLEMVNNAVLKYFLVDLDLYEHLKSLRDCFFLMDAEFSTTICKSLFKKLKFTTNPHELLNFATLHNMLDKAFGSSIGAMQKFSGNLSFTVTDPPLSFEHSSPDVLQCLTLSYTVPWPLNIILSPESISRYGRVFQFLVKMRRMSWVLGGDFEDLKCTLKEKFTVSRELLHSPQYHKVQIYRHSMASLIRALDNYIVTSCIQTSWKEYERELMDVHTLDALYTCHVEYIKNVLFRCLLNRRSVPLMKVLNELFSVVLKFHHTLGARCWHIAEDEPFYSHPFFDQLKEHFNTFEKLARYLHKVILKLTERGYQPHLMELLTMININNFYIA